MNGMKEIKTRPCLPESRILDKAARIPQSAKNAFIHLKDGYGEQQEHGSPERYASDKVTQGADKTANHALNQGRNLAKKTRDTINKGKKAAKEIKQTANAGKKGVKAAGKGIKTSAQTAKTTAKAAKVAADTARRAAAAAVRAMKASIKLMIQLIKVTIKAVIAAIIDPAINQC
jgi:hypothetical protein